MSASILSMLDTSTISVPRILLSLALILASYIAYQVFFHPLRNYPGPLLARLTGGYAAFYVWRKCFHLVTLRLHQEYGSVVRIAPNRLVFNSVEAAHDIYNNPRVTKGQAYIQLRYSGRGTANLLNTLNKEEHRAKRRLIGPLIGEGSMRVFEPEMIRQIDSFLRQILVSSRNSNVVDMSPRCERLGVDVIGQLAFGYQLDTQVDPTYRGIVAGMKNLSDRSTLYYTWSRLRIFDIIFNLHGGKRILDGFFKPVQKMIQARMQLPKDAKHDFYSLVSGESGESGLVSKDLWAEADFLIAAGGSTTSTAMSGIFFYLSRNADSYERVAMEIRSTFRSGADIVQGPQLSSCKYLRAVIEETMRMSPSTPGHAWREQDKASVAAGEPFVVDGHLIPPGTQVAVSQYSIQHNEAYFPESYKFRPERWLTSDASDLDSTANGAEASQQKTPWANRRAFMPFSTGDRACAGKSMAWLEMRLTIAKTLWYFDFEQAPGEAGNLGGGREDGPKGRTRVDEFQLKDSIIVDHSGPNLVFTPRGDFWRDME